MGRKRDLTDVETAPSAEPSCNMLIDEFLHSLLDRPAHQAQDARDPISLPAIRTWCDVIGELNPVFTGDGMGAVAPPATMQMWTFPGLLPGRSPDAGPAMPGDLDAEARATLATFGYTGTLATTTDQEFLQPMRPGDRISLRDRYTDVSEEKHTALGPGYFLTTQAEYTNSEGVVIGRMTVTALHFRPHQSGALAAPMSAPDSVPKAVPGLLAQLGAGVQLNVVRIPVTPTLIIGGALATRDYYPVHHDRDFARAHGNPDILMNILTTNGLLARVVGEWTGGAGLVRLKTNLRAPAYAHDTLELHGLVTSIADGHASISVRAVMSAGPHAEALAVVRLAG
jgi:acyl dehydratase